MARRNDIYNGIIAQVGAKNKFFEVLDGMNPAYARHYGMLTGRIGKNPNNCRNSIVFREIGVILYI